MKGVILVLTCFLVVVSCSSKVSKWQAQITGFITSADSVHYTLNTQIDSSELMRLLDETKDEWQQVKVQLAGDTLDPESLKILDAFNTAYFNTKTLSEERAKCNRANNELKIRLTELLADIQEQNGDRSTFCASIQHEKEELTIIRNHAIDIHRRFEELKSSKTQFENDFARYSLN